MRKRCVPWHTACCRLSCVLEVVHHLGEGADAVQVVRCPGRPAVAFFCSTMPSGASRPRRRAPAPRSTGAAHGDGRHHVREQHEVAHRDQCHHAGWQLVARRIGMTHVEPAVPARRSRLPARAATSSTGTGLARATASAWLPIVRRCRPPAAVRAHDDQVAGMLAGLVHDDVGDRARPSLRAAASRSGAMPPRKPCVPWPGPRGRTGARSSSSRRNRSSRMFRSATGSRPPRAAGAAGWDARRTRRSPRAGRVRPWRCRRGEPGFFWYMSAPSVAGRPRTYRICRPSQSNIGTAPRAMLRGVKPRVRQDALTRVNPAGRGVK